MTGTPPRAHISEIPPEVLQAYDPATWELPPRPNFAAGRTPTTFVTPICRAVLINLEEGRSLKEAAGIAGVSYRLVQHWLTVGRKALQARLERPENPSQAPASGDSEGAEVDERYLAFAEAYEISHARGTDVLRQTVQKAAEGSLQVTETIVRDRFDKEGNKIGHEVERRTRDVHDAASARFLLRTRDRETYSERVQHDHEHRIDPKTIIELRDAAGQPVAEGAALPPVDFRGVDPDDVDPNDPLLAGGGRVVDVEADVSQPDEQGEGEPESSVAPPAPRPKD